MEYKFVDEKFFVNNLDVIINTNLGDCDDWLDKYTKILNDGFENIISKGKKSIGIDIGSFKTKSLNVTYIYSETDQFIINFNNNNSLNDFNFYFINFLMPKKLYYEKMFEAFRTSLPEEWKKEKDYKIDIENDDLTYISKKNEDGELEADIKKQIKDELKYYYDNDFIHDEDDIDVQFTSHIKAMPIIKGRNSRKDHPSINVEEKKRIYEEIMKEVKDQDFVTCYWNLARKKYEDLNNVSNSVLYKAAQISKQEFSSIFSNGKTPSRRVVASLALGLKLDLDDIKELYKSAGYAFNSNNAIDFGVILCIKLNYNIDETNAFLYDELGEMPFGSIPRNDDKEGKIK